MPGLPTSRKNRGGAIAEAVPTAAALSLADLIQDPHNARRHTPRSIGSIVDSIHTVGISRGIVIDEDNVILAGNGTVEAALEAELTKLIVVDQDPSALTVIRRHGLTPAQKVRLALDDNRSGELSAFDPTVLREMADDGLDISALWTPTEWELLTDLLPELDDREPELADPEPVRDPDVTIAGTVLRLTADEDAQMADFLARWHTLYGSTIGAGTTLVAALTTLAQTDGASA